MKRKRHHPVIVDAAGQSPGRLASAIVQHLTGKLRLSYQPHHDWGERVIVKNAAQVVWTGKKREQKVYRRHTMHPGGLKVTPLNRFVEGRPESVIKEAVTKMLPKNKFRSARLRRLRFV